MGEGMDFGSMKRRDLQELCKKHEIPANSTNSEMIERLKSLFQAQKNSKRRGCLKGSNGSSGEGSKKVTFVLEEEEGVGNLGFERNTGGKTWRRGQVRVLDAPVRSTRSRGLAESVVWSPVIEKRRTRAGAEAVCVNSGEAESGALHGKRLRDVSEAVVQKKPKKQAAVSEISAQIVRRTTRTSSNLLDEETAYSDIENVEKERLSRRGKRSEAVAAEPVRRTTRSASNLLDEDTVPSEVENVEKKKLSRQGKHREVIAADLVRRATRSSSNLLEEPYYEKPVNQVKVTEPVRRLTRSSVNVVEDEVSQPVVKGKLRKRAAEHVPEGKESAVLVSDIEAVNTKRSTRSSLKFLDDDNSSLGLGKPHKRRNEDVEVSVSDTKAVISPTRKTRRSSRPFQDEKSLPAVGEAQEQGKKRISRRTNAEITVSESEAVKSPTKRTTRSSSRFLEEEKPLPVFVRANKQVKKLVPVSDSESVVSPTKRSTRGSSRKLADESSQPVVGNLGAEADRTKLRKQAKKVGVSKASSRSETVTEPTRRMTRHSLVPEGKSSNKSKIRASKKGALAASVGKKLKAVGKDKFRKHAKSVRSRRGVSISGEVKEKSPKVAPPKGVSRGSRRNASLGKKSKQETTSSGSGTGKRKNIQRQHREHDHDQTASKPSISGSKRRAESEISEVAKKFGESTRRTTRSASKHRESHIMRVVTSDEDVERSSRKRMRAVDLEDGHVERRKNVQLGALGIQNVGSRSSSRKSMTITPTESDVVQRETKDDGNLSYSGNHETKDHLLELQEVMDTTDNVFLPCPGPTLAIDLSVAVRTIDRGNEVNDVNDNNVTEALHSPQPVQLLEEQSTQVRELYDESKHSSGNHETEDHNIITGDETEGSVLHDVVKDSENISFPEPSSGAFSVDSIADETHVAKYVVNDVIVANDSQVQQSPMADQSLEDDKAILSKGASNSEQSTQVRELYDESKHSSGNHETEDHNIVSGDETEGSVLHDVVKDSEKISFPESSSGAFSVDSIADETHVAKDVVNDVIVANDSQMQQSPMADQSLEDDKVILSEGAGNSEQSTQVRELYDESMHSSGNHETEDHNIVSGDETEDSVLHDVVKDSENISFPEPSSGAFSVDSVADKTHVAKAVVNDVIVANDSQVQQSPMADQSLEDDKVILSEGAGNSEQSTQVRELYDESKHSSGNHETEDHIIESGDETEDSVLHDVVNDSENISFPEPSSGAFSVDRIADETHVAKNVVNDVIVVNDSQVQQSPMADQSLEDDKAILSEGGGNSEQCSPKQELKYDAEVTPGGNQSTVDRDILCRDQTGDAKASKVSGIEEIVVSDGNEKSMSEVHQSPASIQLQEVENTILFEGSLNAMCDPSTAECQYRNVDITLSVAESDTCGVADLPRASCSEMESSEAGPDGEPAKISEVIGIGEIVVSDGNKKSMSEVHQSPASIQLQEVENTILSEGSLNAMYDPSTPDCQYRNVDATLSVAESDTGGVADLPRASCSEMESSEAGPDGEPAKISDETLVVSCLQSSGAGVEEVKEACQSATSFRGSEQAGLDCGSIKVSKETTCSSNSHLSGAGVSETKGACSLSSLSLVGSDGAGTIGKGDGEIPESSFISLDIQSTTYSVTTKGTGVITDDQVEAKSTLGMRVHSSDEQVAAEFPSSFAMASDVLINQTRFVNNDNPGDMTQSTLEIEGVPLEGTIGATSLTYAETSVTPSQTPEAEKVVHDGLSSAFVSRGLDREVDMHFSGQQRGPIGLSSGVVSDDSSPSLAPADCRVVTQETMKPADELVDAKLGQNLELADAEEIENRGSLNGEANDDCEDMSAKEHGNASDLQEAHELSGEPLPTDFSPHGTSESPEYQEHMGKENDQATSAEGKLVKEDAIIEDDARMVKEDNAPVGKFEEVLERCDTFSLTPLYRVRFDNMEATSSAALETPASQVTSLHKEKVVISDGFTNRENITNASGEKVHFSSEDLQSTVSPSANVREDHVTSLHKEEVVISDGFTNRENITNASGEKVHFSSEDLQSTVSPSANVREDHALLEGQEDKLIERNDADENVASTRAERLLEATLNIETSILCSTSPRDSVYEKPPPAFEETLVCLQEGQVSAGKKTDSATEYAQYKVDISISGMAPYETLEVEKRTPKYGQSSVECQDPTSAEIREFSAIEDENTQPTSERSLVGKRTPNYGQSSVGCQDPTSAEIKEFFAIEDENTQPTSERSLVGLHAQMNKDNERGSMTRTDDLAGKVVGERDTMEHLFGHFNYLPHEDASTRYTECSDGKLDCWGFGDMTDDSMNLSQADYGLNYKEPIPDEVGLSNKHQGQCSRYHPIYWSTST